MKHSSVTRLQREMARQASLAAQNGTDGARQPAASAATNGVSAGTNDTVTGDWLPASRLDLDPLATFRLS